jgi:ribosomal-protein-serine acetyltransferase
MEGLIADAEAFPIACRIALSDGRWLRLLEESDGESLYAVVAANRDHLARWLPWAPGETLESALAFIRRAREQVTNNGGFQAALVEDGQIVGMVGFTALSWQDRSARIGYWLAESAQGRGTMTRAVGVLTDHALGTWQLDRVEIRVASENTRSRAIPERLGFRLERVLHDAQRVGDSYIDHAVYGMRSSTWFARGSHGVS